VRAVALDDALDAATYGVKAARLAVALRANLPVPPGIALPVTLVEAIALADPAATAALLHVAKKLTWPLAVRSSAVGEDSARASFAGQHVTRLGVHGPAALVDGVRAVRESARSEPAHRYRERLRLAREFRIAAIVQTMVAADVAGVMFTRDPISGIDERVIEASWGLGEAVVAGRVVPDVYRVSRAGRLLEQRPGVKSIAIRVPPQGMTVEEAVALRLVRALCLDESRLLRLNALANECEALFCADLDIEWAWALDQPYLLQCRPITTFAA
jgi:pyruvate, water dikinase